MLAQPRRAMSCAYPSNLADGDLGGISLYHLFRTLIFPPGQARHHDQMIEYTKGRDVIFGVGDEFLGRYHSPSTGLFFFCFLFPAYFSHFASSSGLHEHLGY